MLLCCQWYAGSIWIFVCDGSRTRHAIKTAITYAIDHRDGLIVQVNFIISLLICKNFFFWMNWLEHWRIFIGPMVTLFVFYPKAILYPNWFARIFFLSELTQALEDFCWSCGDILYVLSESDFKSQLIHNFFFFEWIDSSIFVGPVVTLFMFYPKAIPILRISLFVPA